MDFIINFLVAAVAAGTPLLFGTLGEIMNERVGHLNLGVEGMMSIGACAGFLAGYHTDNFIIALAASFIAAALSALIYALLTVTLMANQNVTGLTLTIFGIGLSNFIGIWALERSETGTLKLPEMITAQMRNISIPGLSDIPVIGPLLFSYSPFVYIGIIIAIVLAFYLNKTKSGLNLQAIGHNPGAADAAGIKVTQYKYTAGRRNLRHWRRLLRDDYQRRGLGQQQCGRFGLDRRGARYFCQLEAGKCHWRVLCVRCSAYSEILCSEEHFPFAKCFL